MRYAAVGLSSASCMQRASPRPPPVQSWLSCPMAQGRARSSTAMKDSMLGAYSHGSTWIHSLACTGAFQCAKSCTMAFLEDSQQAPRSATQVHLSITRLPLLLCREQPEAGLKSLPAAGALPLSPCATRHRDSPLEPARGLNYSLIRLPWFWLVSDKQQSTPVYCKACLEYFSVGVFEAGTLLIFSS